MSTRLPVVRQISWLATIPQFLALAVAMAIGYLVRPQGGMFWGGAVYLIYSFGSRRLVPRDHRAGVKLMRQQRFAESIPDFQASLAFFDRFPWIDRFRSIVLMSPSAVSYREMALTNIAFCYAQLGDGKQARAYYERCLEQYPESVVAPAALRLMDAAVQASAG